MEPNKFDNLIKYICDDFINETINRSFGSILNIDYINFYFLTSIKIDWNDQKSDELIKSELKYARKNLVEFCIELKRYIVDKNYSIEIKGDGIDHLNNIINWLDDIIEFQFSKRNESSYIEKLNHDKLNEYKIAKEWGYKNYIQNACGIEEYAIIQFIRDFERWYSSKYNNKNCKGCVHVNKDLLRDYPCNVCDSYCNRYELPF